jgi:hypothetical protein
LSRKDDALSDDDRHANKSGFEQSRIRNGHVLRQEQPEPGELARLRLGPMHAEQVEKVLSVIISDIARPSVFRLCSLTRTATLSSTSSSGSPPPIENKLPLRPSSL